jgi:hypothetical protein
MGVEITAFGLLVKALTPKIGRMAYQIGPHSSFDESEYQIDLGLLLLLGVDCLAAGVICCAALYIAAHRRRQGLGGRPTGTTGR